MKKIIVALGLLCAVAALQADRLSDLQAQLDNTQSPVVRAAILRSIVDEQRRQNPATQTRTRLDVLYDQLASQQAQLQTVSTPIVRSMLERSIEDTKRHIHNAGGIAN